MLIMLFVNIYEIYYCQNNSNSHWHKSRWRAELKFRLRYWNFVWWCQFYCEIPCSPMNKIHIHLCSVVCALYTLFNCGKGTINNLKKSSIIHVQSRSKVYGCVKFICECANAPVFRSNSICVLVWRSSTVTISVMASESTAVIGKKNMGCQSHVRRCSLRLRLTLSQARDCKWGCAKLHPWPKCTLRFLFSNMMQNCQMLQTEKSVRVDGARFDIFNCQNDVSVVANVKKRIFS